MSCGLQVVRRYVRRFSCLPHLFFFQGASGVGHGFRFGAHGYYDGFLFRLIFVFLEGWSSVEMGFGLGALGSKYCTRYAAWAQTRSLATDITAPADIPESVCGNVCGTHPLNRTGLRKLYICVHLGPQQYTRIGYTHRGYLVWPMADAQKQCATC